MCRWSCSCRPNGTSTQRDRYLTLLLVLTLLMLHFTPALRPRLPLERPGQEHAERVGPVVGERLAGLEPELLVQPPGGREELGRTGLQAQPGEAHPPGLGDDVLQHHRRDPAT